MNHRQSDAQRGPVAPDTTASLTPLETRTERVLAATPRTPKTANRPAASSTRRSMGGRKNSTCTTPAHGTERQKVCQQLHKTQLNETPQSLQLKRSVSITICTHKNTKTHTKHDSGPETASHTQAKQEQKTSKTGENSTPCNWAKKISYEMSTFHKHTTSQPLHTTQIPEIHR